MKSKNTMPEETNKRELSTTVKHEWNDELSVLALDLWHYGTRGMNEQAKQTAEKIGAMTGKHATAKAYLRHVIAIRKLEVELGVE